MIVPQFSKRMEFQGELNCPSPVFHLLNSKKKNWRSAMRLNARDLDDRGSSVSEPYLRLESSSQRAPVRQMEMFGTSWPRRSGDCVFLPATDSVLGHPVLGRHTYTWDTMETSFLLLPSSPPRTYHAHLLHSIHSFCWQPPSLFQNNTLFLAALPAREVQPIPSTTHYC